MLTLLKIIGLLCVVVFVVCLSCSAIEKFVDWLMGE